MMKKKLVARVAVILCVVLAVCTFLSKTMYHRSLPVVHSETVKSGIVPRSTMAEGKIICIDGMWEVQFSLPLDEGIPYGVGVSVSMRIYAATTKDDIAKQMISSKVTERTLSSDGRMLEYVAPLELLDGEPFANAPIEISVSTLGESYELVVPLQSVFKGGEYEFVQILKTRRGLFGDEAYIEATPVATLASNASVAAITSGSVFRDMEIVSYSSRPLLDGETVWVE